MDRLEEHPIAPGLSGFAGAVGATWPQLSSLASTESEMRQESYGERWGKQRDGGDLETTNWGKDGQEQGENAARGGKREEAVVKEQE